MSVTWPVAGEKAESLPPGSSPMKTVPSGATAMSSSVPRPLTTTRADTEGSMVKPGIGVGLELAASPQPAQADANRASASTRMCPFYARDESTAA